MVSGFGGALLLAVSNNSIIHIVIFILIIALNDD